MRLLPSRFITRRKLVLPEQTQLAQRGGQERSTPSAVLVRPRRRGLNRARPGIRASRPTCASASCLPRPPVAPPARRLTTGYEARPKTTGLVALGFASRLCRARASSLRSFAHRARRRLPRTPPPCQAAGYSCGNEGHPSPGGFVPLPHHRRAPGQRLWPAEPHPFTPTGPPHTGAACSRSRAQRALEPARSAPCSEASVLPRTGHSHGRVLGAWPQRERSHQPSRTP